ncbi:IS110 family transposase [Sinomonas sp. P47F7]|uniref:IS110 family transposase n=1 Tax=Sinomonas sp. P47F7 TaxID=3410987 RepID=UPI003BF4DB60
MDVVHERAAGMDISKRDAKVAVRVPGKRAGTFTTDVTTWGSTVGQILELIEFLEAQQVTTVVMEATSDYWKPFCFLMEDRLPVMLVNAKQARNIPGRKTDVSDSAWLAQLAAHGLLRPSFVPPEPIRQLRDLTRARAVAVRDRTRQVQRLEKFLESSGIKLSAVASELTGASSRAILVEDAIAPFRLARQALTTIPGISTAVAEVIIAETGADMAVFETPGHLASWAGVCPGSNESAGRVKSSHTRPGDKYLKAALGVAAMSVSRAQGTYLAAKYRRIAARRGPVLAVVAIEHAILTAAWHMLRNGEVYTDPGADYYTRLNPQKATNRAIRQLQNLGHNVTITPAAA